VPITEKDSEPWRPFALHPAAQAGIITILLSMIVALETLYQVSHARSGLFNDPSSLIGRYSWLYSLPIILFVIGIVLEVFDSAIRAVELLTAFSHTPQPADRFITYTPLAHTAATLIWHSMGHRQLISLLSTLSTFLLAAIKIVVAGLFVPLPTTTISHLSLSTVSSFNGDFHFNPSYIDTTNGFFTSSVSCSFPRRRWVPSRPNSITSTGFCSCRTSRLFILQSPL
jgi:hypothetical protein